MPIMARRQFRKNNPSIPMHSSRKLLLAATLGLLLGGALGWQARRIWLGPAAAPLEAAATGRASLPDLAAGRGKAPQADAPRGRGPSASLQETLSQALTVGAGREKLFTTEQFAGYLQRHQRDAKSLLTVYRITKDEALLREAYEKFPENPHIAAQALESLNLPLEEKLALVGKVRQAHPGDAWADMLQCSTLLKEGRLDEALDALRNGLGKPGFDLGYQSQELDLREALMSTGKSPTEARVLGLSWPEYPSGLVELSSRGRERMEQLIEAGQEEEALALAGDLLGLGRRLEENGGQTLVAEVVGHAFKNNVLRALPQDVEMGDTGKIAEEFLQISEEEISAFSEGMKGFDERIKWHFQNLDDAGVELYFQILEQRGERAALEWAEAYHGPAPVPQK